MSETSTSREADTRLLTRFAYALCAAALVCLPPSRAHPELGALRNWQLVLHPLLFVALAALRFEPLSAPGPSRRLLQGSAAVALLWVLSAQWAKYFAFAINGVDFSIFDWMLHNTLDGRFMYSPIYDVNHFGVHPSYWMLPLVPLHALWPSPLLLSTITGLVVWGACIPLWHLVRGRTDNGWLAWLACVAYLTCAWTGRIIDGGFRPEVLYPLAGFSLLLAWERRRWVFPAALLLLSVKEDAALYLAGFSLAVLVSQRERWREGLGLLVLALGVFSLNVGVVQPAALASAGRERPAYMSFWSDYGRTMPEVIRFMLVHPFRVAADVLRSGWIKLFGPLLLLPLFSPRALGMMLPGLVLLGAATYSQMRDFGTYYPIPLLAPALWGTVETCTAERARIPRGATRALLATVLLAFPLFWSGYVKLPPSRFALHGELSQLDAMRSAPLPPGPLCAQTVLFPHLPYALAPTPLFSPSCLEQPGAWALVHLELDPYPLKRSDLAQLVTRAQRLGHARALAEGTWILGVPRRPGTDAAETPPDHRRRGQ